VIFTETPLKGAYIIEPRRISDERGYFARLLCARELAEQGLQSDIKQTNIGVSLQKGTQRGLHYQKLPHAEVKIVRCPRGAIFDVIVDLRPESETFKQWFGIELNAENALALYVPEGCAQGYRTLQDNTEIYYHTTAFFAPEFATGVRYDDPVFGIEWPGDVSVISEQDKTWPDFTD
jgi:dTDP-4-dehydrorhamnose 3,5-epimerase